MTEHWKTHHSASGEGEREIQQVPTKQSSVCVNLKYDRTLLLELSMVHSMMLVLALHRECLGNADIELLLTPVL